VTEGEILFVAAREHVARDGVRFQLAVWSVYDMSVKSILQVQIKRMGGDYSCNVKVVRGRERWKSKVVYRSKNNFFSRNISISLSICFIVPLAHECIFVQFHTKFVFCQLSHSVFQVIFKSTSMTLPD
jgi:hypothetical protein